MNHHSTSITIITDNRKSKYNYQLKHTFEAGIILAGWEVKSLRAKKAQLTDSYVIIKNKEAFLLNSHIELLPTTSKYDSPNPNRTRKLLLNKNELSKLADAIKCKGLSIIPLNFHLKNNIIKVDIALAKGKKLHDKRESEKLKDWNKHQKKINFNF